MLGLALKDVPREQLSEVLTKSELADFLNGKSNRTALIFSAIDRTELITNEKEEEEEEEEEEEDKKEKPAEGEEGAEGEQPKAEGEEAAKTEEGKSDDFKLLSINVGWSQPRGGGNREYGLTCGIDESSSFWISELKGPEIIWLSNWLTLCSSSLLEGFDIVICLSIWLIICSWFWLEGSDIINLLLSSCSTICSTSLFEVFGSIARFSKSGCREINWVSCLREPQQHDLNKVIRNSKHITIVRIIPIKINIIESSENIKMWNRK